MKVAGRACAQAGRVVIMEPAILLLPRAGIAVDIVFATITVHHILMTMLARVILAEVVMNNADTMVILIVQICRQAVEPPEALLSSSIAVTTSSPPTASSPSSGVISRSRRKS